MKNLLLCSAIAVLALTSCSKNEGLPTQGEDTPITFSTYTGARAIEKSAFAGGDAIGVSAFYKDGAFASGDFTDNFFKDMKVSTTDGTTWTNAVIRYWPNKEGTTLSFVAYYPAMASSIVTNPLTVGADTDKGKVSFTVTQKDAIAEQQDFMYAVNLQPTKSTSVSLAFKHALSKIVFKAKLNDSYTGATVNITSIKVTGVKNSGTFTLNPALDGTGTWAEGETTKDFAVVSSATAVTDAESTMPQNLLMIPQAKGGSITVDYEIVYAAQDNQPALTIPESKTIVIDADWVMNKVYTYSLIISLTGVEFTPSVSDNWETAL